MELWYFHWRLEVKDSGLRNRQEVIQLILLQMLAYKNLSRFKLLIIIITKP